MKKISLAFVIPSVFIGISSLLSINAFAYDTCSPSNIFVPCSYGGYNYDTVMRGGGTVDFYVASSFTVAHINQYHPTWWTLTNNGVSCNGRAWLNGTLFGCFSSSEVDSAASNFLWQGVGSVSSLTINLDPSGGGGVVSIPEGDGIYCGIDGYNICQFDFQKNSDVEIQAYPADGWAFAYWEWNNGASSSTENPMTINMDSAKTVKAKFFRTFRNAVGSFRKNIGDITGGQCLDYVEYETDLPDEVCVGDAGDCYDQAQAAGYAVGSTPREGSIVVFAKVPNTSLSHGHVGIVKYYDTANNKIIIHESNWCDDNCEIVGEHEEILGTHAIVGYVYYTP